MIYIFCHWSTYTPGFWVGLLRAELVSDTGGYRWLLVETGGNKDDGILLTSFGNGARVPFWLASRVSPSAGKLAGTLALP